MPVKSRFWGDIAGPLGTSHLGLLSRCTLAAASGQSYAIEMFVLSRVRKYSIDVAPVMLN